MKRTFKAAALTAAAALALAGCGAAPEKDSSSTTSGGTTATDEAKPGGNASGVKACMVSDEGGFDDKSFNQSGFEGLERAGKELGVETRTAESGGDADYVPNIDSMISEGCSLIIGVGYKMAEQMDTKAKENPDVKFALVDSTFASAPENAKALVFNTAEASYLAGYVAAGMSSSGKIGTFVGMNIPTTAIFADGYQDGMKKYNEDHGTNVALVGWDKDSQDGMATGDFSEVSKGQTFSKQQIEQGVDVIMPVAGPVGAGALAAAKDAGEGKVAVVWVDADGFDTQPEFQDYILTSVKKEIGQAVFDTVKMVVDGKFDSKPYIGTLENGGVSIAPFHNFDDRVPAELKAEVKKLQQQIISGEIKVESQNQPK